jgi:hypothetical protein
MIPKKFIEYYGDAVRWFTGKIININDPLQIGRVQVRIDGIHGDNLEFIPDEDLPWAIVVSSSNNGGIANIGNPLGIQTGAFVFGMFLDGQNSQIPMVIGSIPRDGHMNPAATGTHNLYSVDSAIGEPNDPSAAIYPNNLVFQTTSGHVKEYDNTDSAERIREFHRSGTFYQVNPDGTFIEHIVGGRYTVIATDDALHISGNVKVIIDNNADISVGGNVTLTASDGTVTVDTPTTKLTGDLQVDGSITVDGTVTADGEVTGNNIKLSTHTHSGVQSGPSSTGLPI